MGCNGCFLMACACWATVHGWQIAGALRTGRASSCAAAALGAERTSHCSMQDSRAVIATVSDHSATKNSAAFVEQQQQQQLNMPRSICRSTAWQDGLHHADHATSILGRGDPDDRCHW